MKICMKIFKNTVLVYRAADEGVPRKGENLKYFGDEEAPHFFFVEAGLFFVEKVF